MFVNGTKIIKFKAKDSEINAIPLYLGNVSKDFSVDVKKTAFYEYVYDFSNDYDATAFVWTLKSIQSIMSRKRFKILFCGIYIYIYIYIYGIHH